MSTTSVHTSNPAGTELATPGEPADRQVAGEVKSLIEKIVKETPQGRSFNAHSEDGKRLSKLLRSSRDASLEELTKLLLEGDHEQKQAVVAVLVSYELKRSAMLDYPGIPSRALVELLLDDNLLQHSDRRGSYSRRNFIIRALENRAGCSREKHDEVKRTLGDLDWKRVRDNGTVTMLKKLAVKLDSSDELAFSELKGPQVQLA